jgi:hypothetical protein
MLHGYSRADRAALICIKATIELLRFTAGDLRRRENADWIISAVVSRSYVKGSVKWVARAEKAANVRGVERLRQPDP